MKARPYQDECVTAVRQSYLHHQSVMAVMATGTGKTHVASMLCDRALKHGRILWLAHTRELVYQAAAKLAQVTGEEPAIEMAEATVNENSILHKARVVVASIQTMHRRYKKFRPDEFSLVVVDECHHAVSPSWFRVISYFKQSRTTYVLGLTATPDRADEKALGRVFDHVPYVYDIRRGIEDGYLVPIRQTQVECRSLDFSKVKANKRDLDERELAKVIEQETALHEVAAPLADLAKGRRTVVFCLRVAQAKAMAEIIDRYHGRRVCEVVDGKMDKDSERPAALKRFREGESTFCLNVGVLTEGWDDPGVEVIALARPTKSRALFTQMVGRGTRPLPGVPDGIDDAEARRQAIAASAKPSVEVIDFVGNAGRHELVTTADILGGDYDDEAVAAAKEYAKGKRDLDIDEIMAEQQRLLEQRRQREMDELFDAALEQITSTRQRAFITAEADYHTETTDAFDRRPQMRSLGKSSGTPPTENQVRWLEKQGVKDAASMTRTEAGRMIGQLKERFDRGLATNKQVKLLRRYGIDATDMSIGQATREIDVLARNGWKRKAVMAVERGEV